MALPAKKQVAHSVSMVILLLLLLSAASFSVQHAHARSMGLVGDGVILPRPPPDDREHDETYIQPALFPLWPDDGRKYHACCVMLRKRPMNGGGEAAAMDDDDKDARRRWYESFLPSILTDSGEPRLIECYTLGENGFLAWLTRDEALALAKRPRVVRSMSSPATYGPFRYSPATCGFVTAITKRSSARSRPAF